MKIKFSKSQWVRISEILGNMGIVFFASTGIPFLLGADKTNIPDLISGLVLSTGCIISSVILQKKGDK